MRTAVPSTQRTSVQFQSIAVLMFTIIIALGIVFRVVQIDHKIYWYDEAMSSLRVTGHTHHEFVSAMFTNRITPVSEIQRYQQLDPEKGLENTVIALTGNAEHPPLFYLAAYGWIRNFGDSIASMRSVAAIFSLLTLPALIWLGKELFESEATVGLAIALLSVSPLQLLYAQEARQYSLWTLTIILSSAALLRACRLRSVASWMLYAITTVLGLYTFLLHILVIAAHGIYIFYSERQHWKTSLLPFLKATAFAGLAFSPWLVLVIVNADRIQQSSSGAFDGDAVSTLLREWIKNLGSVFLDIQRGEVTAPLVCILILVSFCFLCREAPKHVRLFILTLVLVTTIPLMLLDLAMGWDLSSRARYMLPGYLGIQLAVTFLLSRQFSAPKVNQQILWRSITALVITAGIASGVVISQSSFWWTKGLSRHNQDLAAIINAAPAPLLITDNSALNPGELLSLSHLLDDRTRVLMTLQSQAEKVVDRWERDRFSDIFVFKPSDRLQRSLEQVYTLQPVHPKVQFFQLLPKAQPLPL